MSRRVGAPRAPAPRAARAPSGPAAAVRTPAWAWLALVAVAVLVAVARVRLLDVPLERDEGEYAYAGQLILRGIPPYQLVYNMKLPGAYAVYALFLALFGQTARGVHLGLLLVTLASITLLFLVARRLFGARAGVVAAVTYGLLHGTMADIHAARNFVALDGVVPNFQRLRLQPREKPRHERPVAAGERQEGARHSRAPTRAAPAPPS